MKPQARTRVKAILCTWTLLIAAPSAAQHTHAPSARTCMERSGGVTSAMLDCLSESYEEIDSKLNHAWSALLPTLESSQRQSFRDAQRVWVNYRDTSCAAEASLQNGSLASVARADCRVRLTTDRFHWLERMRPERDPAEQ